LAQEDVRGDELGDEFKDGFPVEQQVSGDKLGDEFKGFFYKIMGGRNKQCVPVKQGIKSGNQEAKGCQGQDRSS